MRALAAIGAIVFAYLALIPAGLIASTLDSACAGGECSTPLASDIAFSALYALALAALVAVALSMAAYAVRPSAGGERLIRRALLGTVAAIALVALVLFALLEPVAAAVTVAIGAVSLVLLARGRWTGRGADPRSNGRPPLNGHPLNGHPR